MEGFVKGDVVIVPFPFSDLSSVKLRPALVVADLKSNDLMLCQITSKFKNDSFSISLQENDFSEGGLRQASYIRPNRIFTSELSIIRYKSGKVKSGKLKEVRDKIVSLLDQ